MLKDNWLNTVSSGGYKFTFMIVDKDIWNDATKGSFNKEQTIAQGKGIIVAEDGVESAYSVQNVNIMTRQGAISNGYSKATLVHFDIMEPLGFGFLERTLTVSRRLGNPQNFKSVNWVLLLDFIGRDPVTGASRKREGTFVYALTLKDITATIGEAGAKYFCEFNNMDTEAKLNTVTETDVTVKNVTTVKTFAENLETALNKNASAIRPDSTVAGPAGRMVQTEVVYKVVLGSSMTTQAQDYFRLPSFNLSEAPWGGTADTSTAGAQSESLEALGIREITINNNTQLCARIRELIAEVPSYAEHNLRAQKSGITYDIAVTSTMELIGEQDTTLNLQRKRVTLHIGIKTEATQIPPDKVSITQLRNKKGTQTERFNELIFPNLVKKYTYQYTGENTEVMDIDLNLNQYFYNALAPQAGVYYADNHAMFEANIVNVDALDEPESLDANINETGNPLSTRFLSDIPLTKYNIEQSPIFRVQPVGPHGQQVNETTTADAIANLSLLDHAARTRDAAELTLEVRGDPIFLGRDGYDIFTTQDGNNAPRTVYMAFINFTPNPEDLLNKQRKGPVDMISTGIYRIHEVNSKFQQGSFTQTVKTYRDANSNTYFLLDQLIELKVD